MKYSRSSKLHEKNINIYQSVYLRKIYIKSVSSKINGGMKYSNEELNLKTE